jgi:hypothetical protein
MLSRDRNALIVQTPVVFPLHFHFEDKALDKGLGLLVLRYPFAPF